MLLALDAAGACNDGEVAAADLHAVDIDHAVVGVELAVGFLVRLRHAAAGLDHRVGQHPALGVVIDESLVVHTVRYDMKIGSGKIDR